MQASPEISGVAEVFLPAAVGDVFGGVIPAVAVGQGKEPVAEVFLGAQGFQGLGGFGLRSFEFRVASFEGLVAGVRWRVEGRRGRGGRELGQGLGFFLEILLIEQLGVAGVLGGGGSLGPLAAQADKERFGGSFGCRGAGFRGCRGLAAGAVFWTAERREARRFGWRRPAGPARQRGFSR